MIPALQILAGLCWLGAALFYSRSVIRIYRGTGNWVDVFRALFVFVGLTQFGFSVRWKLFPATVQHMDQTELVFWAILYLMSAIEAVALVVASFFFERLRGPK